jgi:hypothetical protein|eukprot:SAG25_NODE_781_length_5369_cov_4.185958_2_plen_131_part_00
MYDNNGRGGWQEEAEEFGASAYTYWGKLNASKLILIPGDYGEEDSFLERVVTAPSIYRTPLFGLLLLPYTGFQWLATMSERKEAEAQARAEEEAEIAAEEAKAQRQCVPLRFTSLSRSFVHTCSPPLPFL